MPAGAAMAVRQLAMPVAAKAASRPTRRSNGVLGLAAFPRFMAALLRGLREIHGGRLTAVDATCRSGASPVVKDA